MPENRLRQLPDTLQIAYEFAKVLFFVYCFLVSIDLMGSSFKESKDTLKPLLDHATAHPLVGLVIGVVMTSIIQSSSTTTSIVVAMVGAGTLTLQSAIPIIMGANIGTTVTNTIVSFGYAGRKTEFRRSFGAAIVHDMFNISAAIILFPVEMYTGILYKSATFLTHVFGELGGFKIISPLKIIIKPVSDILEGVIPNKWVLLVLALMLLFFAMKKIIENMKGIVMEKVEFVLNRYLFRNALISFLFGMFLTSLVQSSSITTSIIVPIAGAGILTVEQIFPYTLGANVGTTITAILAALTMGIEVSLAVAFAHLLFNVFGIMIIYPIRRVPIWIARTIAGFVSKSKKHFLIFLLIYILLHTLPILAAFID